MKVEKISKKGLIIWLVAASFFCYEFLLRTVVGTFEHPIVYDLGLNLVTFAILSSVAYQLIYGLMQIPAGVIVDRYGLKRSLALAALCCAIGTFVFSQTHYFYTALIMRILVGFGSSFGFICLLIIVYEWFPRSQTALYIGLSQFLGTLGPMFAAGPLTSLSESGQTNWRYIFLFLALLGVGIALLAYKVVRNNQDVTQVRMLKKNFSFSQMGKLLNPQMIMIAAFSGLVYFSIEYLSENSTKGFLKLWGYSEVTTSYMITLTWLSYAICAPLMGWLSDRLKRRRIVMQAGAFLGMLGIALLLYLPVHIVLVALSFILIGAGSASQCVAFAIMAENCAEEHLGFGLSLNNATMVVLMALNAPLIAWILEYFSIDAVIGIRHYQATLSILALLYFLAMLLAFKGIQETFCKSQKEATILERS